MRITKGTQEKLEAILKSQGYSIRYEKGNFKAGHCVVLLKKTIVINKFIPLEGIIQTLSEIVRDIEIDTNEIEEELAKMVTTLKAEPTKVEEEQAKT
ncbi:MAG: hypothetical protein ACKVTZ_11015 [Bacteroidia bacterium]